MFQTIFIFHLLGAVFVVVFTLLSLVDAQHERWSKLPMRARGMTLGLFFEIASGSALALLMPTESLFDFCRNIGVYTALILMSMLFVYSKLVRARHASLFPTRFVVGGVLLTTAVTLPVFVVALV